MVGVNVCGSSPNKLVDPINIISVIIIRDQVCPFVEWVDIICFVTNLVSHSWKVCKRLLTRRFDTVNNIEGNIMIKITTGRPIIVGVMKEANRFSFIFVLMGFLFLYFS